MTRTGNDVELMRDQISKVYGPDALNWILRCQRMSTSQVVAIWLRMKEKGKFDRRRKEVRKIQEKNQNYHQMNLWDYGIDL